MKIKVINGPNLNLLGIRNTAIYGKETLDEIYIQIQEEACKLGIEVEFFQSNHEGNIIDEIQNSRGKVDGIIINPGGYTHYSVGIRDALESVEIPTIEVHLSNIFIREGYRKVTVTGEVVIGIIAGLGSYGYILALLGLKRYIEKNRSNLLLEH